MFTFFFFHIFKFSRPCIQTMRPKRNLRCVQLRGISKETKDILTDLLYGAIQTLNYLQGSARATPHLQRGTIVSREDTARDEKRPHPYSETSSLQPELPKGPILSSASLPKICYQPAVPTVLPLKEVPSGNLETISFYIPFSISDLSMAEDKLGSFSEDPKHFAKEGQVSESRLAPFLYFFLPPGPALCKLGLVRLGPSFDLLLFYF